MDYDDPTLTAQPPTADEPSDAPPTPPHVGKYRVEKVLGQGSFGVVYLAFDGGLDRFVAIKVPHRRLVARPEDAEPYLAEARTVARLDHPNIVPVYETGHTDDCPLYVVSKYVAGSTLARRIADGSVPVLDAAGLVATVAEALHHAHQHRVVHRDVKPGNILIDAVGKPYVADFGLALRAENVGRGPAFAGTPAYMSPEQARREGHRVDGRTDVFSLGVVFYELLAGGRPFGGATQSELLAQIQTHDPVPPRQLTDGVPAELERICLRALAKRAADRYSTAREMAEDLRHFLRTFVGAETLPLVPRTRVAADAAQPPTTDRESVQVVPKGLRSFDAHDMDFFLSLLPGPRDRNGLPDGIRSWKARIEDPDDPFPVGLIYGPSGCGKSSLVKAGLLPRLSAGVTVVYVEATAAGTETRLLNGLRKRFPSLPPRATLAEAVAAVRAGTDLPADGKVLIVLDQFEQWLHAHPDPHSDLVRALRHCDGGRAQCLVLVRDDFWLPVSRFMSELETDLVPHRNIALVDLFDPDHARKVLTAFGRAYGKLPERTRDLTREQSAFLDEAVAGLAQDGKVICVRLAVFADMMKGRPWTRAGLAEVGGTQGIGVSFLEDTFSSPAANPRHRRHQAAARGVLRALLPDAGEDLKGNMRSETDLRAASGYPPAEFADLIRALDGDVRLITPTDPAGADRPEQPAGEKFYQLTHDYLVRPLREWLTRKQRETRRGRAELRLGERAAEWSRRPERRTLPSLGEWAGIRLFTRRRKWATPERQMMGAADRYYLSRTLMIAVYLGLVGWGLARWTGGMRADYYRDRLLAANVDEVPDLLVEMEPYRGRVEARLRAEPPADNRGQLRAALALVRTEPERADYLCDQLLTADAADFAAIRDVLAPHYGRVRDRIWAAADGPDRGPRFRALCALASQDEVGPRWAEHADFVVQFLIGEHSLAQASWVRALAPTPVRDRMLSALALAVEGVPADADGLQDLVGLYRGFAGREPGSGSWRPLLDRLPPPPPAAAMVALVAPPVARGARGGANVGAALVALGQAESVWQHLVHTVDPTCRSYLIDRLPAAGVDPDVLWARLDTATDPSEQRAIVLALGGYPADRFPARCETLVARYRDHPDPGFHGAARWALTGWGMSDRVRQIDRDLATGRPEGNRKWFVDKNLITFSVLDLSSAGGSAAPGRRLAVAITELSERDLEAAGLGRRRPVDPDMPAADLSWHAVAAICNHLTRAAGRGPGDCCYESLADGEFKVVPGAEAGEGYRMPTESEWEHLCGAGAVTRWHFGEAANDLVDRYVNWIGHPLGGGTAPIRVGSLRPNDLGLFDTHGNLWEWCHTFSGAKPITFPEEGSALRGGSFNVPLLGTAATTRNYLQRDFARPHIGCRLVRTIKH